MLPLAIISVFLFGLTHSTLPEREYKVNNIVFLKDHYSWCQVTPIQQIITSPGYQSVTINNNICVGACWSYSIPKTQPAEPGEIIGPYCDSCQPNVTKCYHVTLTAEDTNQAGPKTIQKRIEIIQSCHCKPCDKLQKVECDLSQENTSELPQNMYTNKDSKSTTPSTDLPDKDLMLLLPKINTNVVSKLLNEDLDSRNNASSKLLKILNIWEKMPNKTSNRLDREKFSNILEVLQGSQRPDLNDFVNYINSDDVENASLDNQKLTNVLEKYQKNKIMKNQRNIWLGTPNNEKILEDLRKAQLPSNFGIEGSNLGIKHHYKGSHIGMGIKTNEVEDLQVVTLPQQAEDEIKITTPKVETSSHHPKTGHYVLEEELVHGKMEHLVKGPHGSLVLRPDIKVEKKLNLETDSLTPNHQGVVISYTGDDQNAPKLIDD